MPISILARLRDWLAFHSTYRALKRLDVHLRADLGIEDADMRRLARRAMTCGEQVNLYTLIADDAAPAPQPPAKPPQQRDCPEPARLAVQGS